MSLLGVDVGSVRIGVARSVGTIAVPLEAVPAGDGSIDTVLALIEEHGIVEVVVGHALRLDGTRGPAAQACEAWASALEERAAVPVRLVDERLTTRQAQRGLHEAGRTTRSSRSVIDSASAVVLLQACLDRGQ